MAFGQKKFATWDEALRGLIPEVRQQSVRVAEYTQVIFLQACAAKFGGTGNTAQKRMRGQNGDAAYRCGLYHQIGKALVPAEYQQYRADFAPEERALYRRYPEAGRNLAAALGKDTAWDVASSRGSAAPRDVRRTWRLMLQEACQQHMERWDGSGWPEGLSGSNISLMGQIVGIARELNRLSAGTKDEAPFELAVKTIRAGSGKAWSPELVKILEKSVPQCRKVFSKYIAYTQALPATIALVEKREDRPMGLKYRPMAADCEGTVAAYEAIPWFGGIAGRPGDAEPATDELEEMLKRNKLVNDISFYFLYEASDAVARMNNCRLGLRGVVLQMLPSFFMQGTQLQALQQLFEQEGIPKEQLMLTLPEDAYLALNKGQLEIVQRYLRNGVCLVLDGYHPDRVPAEQLKEQGFTHLRLAPELYGQQATANELTRLKTDFSLIGSGADSEALLKWQLDSGISFTGGTATGAVTDEDGMIRGALAHELSRDGQGA